MQTPLKKNEINKMIQPDSLEMGWESGCSSKRIKVDLGQVDDEITIISKEKAS